MILHLQILEQIKRENLFKRSNEICKIATDQKRSKNVKQKYNISGDSKDKLAYVDFDIMIVGGKEYVGKEEEW